MHTRIEDLLKQWDGEELILRHDRPSGAWIIIAIHSSRRGTPSGGTRMKPYADLATAVTDALNLSLGMTYKFAVANMARGGGKAVLHLPPNFDPAHRTGLLHRYGTLIKQLGGLYETGPDVGTSPHDMDTIAETGAPHVYGLTPAHGGSGSTGLPTAIGVFSAIEATCQHLYQSPSLVGKRILVQGTGSVGGALIGFLQEAGAEILFNDVSETAVHHFRDTMGLTYIPDTDIYDTPCDIFSPNALGGILNQTTIPRLQCAAVVGGANNQLATDTDAQRLHQRGILYAPDYAVNIGGAMAVLSIESEGMAPALAHQKVRGVRETVLEILAAAAAENVSPVVAAQRVAEARLT
ncbi:MAG: valine dehydrogenase [Ardenticatenaceae bacterium]|nr:valine dehydrogenase [Ardenticatenaceae bacterium]